MGTAQELMDHVIEVCDYAEIEQGLDPIGASDILNDLSRFTQWRYIEKGLATPARVWNEFTNSPYYQKYWGG